VNALVKKLLNFADKDYRDGYMQTRVRSGIAYQLRALRKKFGFSQSEMAARTGKTQSVISRLENTEYGKVSVQTLLDVASGLDVALLVQFVSYPEFLARSADMSNDAMQPDTIQESLAYELRDNFARTNVMQFRQTGATAAGSATGRAFTGAAGAFRTLPAHSIAPVESATSARLNNLVQGQLH